MSDNLTIFGTNYTGVTSIKATGTGNGTLTYIRPQGSQSITENGTGIDVTNYASVDVNVASSGGWNYQPKNDGLTHVWFDVTCPDLLRVGLWLNCSNYTNEYIDWGDGTIDDNFQGLNTLSMHYHTYSSLGTYCVTLSSKFFIVNKTTTSGGVGSDPSVFLYSLMAVELAANGVISQGFLAEYPVLKWVYYHDGTLSSSHNYDYELRYNPSLQYFRMAYNSTTPSTYKMGQSAFRSDTNLIRVDNWDYVTRIGEDAFSGCSAFNPPSLPSALTTIDAYAFQDCTSLALTSLPSTVTSIGQYAFDGCESLALTSLPSGITSIAQYTFRSCRSLALTSLPSGLTNISTYAFSSCRSIALTSLPSGVTSIGARAFYACYSLALTSLPSGITSIAEYTFQACLAMPLSSLPSGLTSIGQYAFNACTSMTSISCTGNITTLGTYAFGGNVTYPSALTRVDFPNMAVSSLTTVFGNATASGACQFLAIADIGKTASLGSNAFANCYALQTLVLRRDTAICNLTYATAFTNTPMAGYNNLTGTVYVPNSLINTYKTATNWTTLYNNGTVTFVAIEGSPYEL